MIFYPKFYFKKITDITIDFLRENEIQALILDVDNTLIDFNLKMIDGLKDWHDKIIGYGIKTIILSNTNKVEKVKMVASALNIEYINFAKKPLKSRI